MNPICKTDINSDECQHWMSNVCARCRDLFASEKADPWAAWWHDDTPALYKSDLLAMTAYDCHKLKTALEIEVADMGPEPMSGAYKKLTNATFLWWQKLLLILVYILIIFVCIMFTRWCAGGTVHRKQEEEEEVVEEAPPESAVEDVDAESAPPSTHKKHTVKGWIRHKCRPIFVHSESELRRQQRKREEEERIREANTQRRIEKWTMARQKIDQDREQKSMAKEKKSMEKQHRSTENQQK